MTSVQERKYLRLIKFSYDLSLNVTLAFIKSSILCNYDNSLSNFLTTNRHTIYHLWIHSTRCCECNALPQRSYRELNQEQISKCYNLNGPTTSGHFLRGQSYIKQHCICKVTPKSHCSLKDLDFTLLHTMFRHSVTLSTSVENWLTVIKKIRNNLAHVHSTSNFYTGRLEKWWTKLEGSVIGLAGEIPLEYYLDAIQGQISLLKNADFDIMEKNEILDLIKHVKSDMATIETKIDDILRGQTDLVDQMAEIVDEAKRDIVCKERTESVLLQDKILDVYVSSCADTKLQISSLEGLQRSQIEKIKQFQEETSENLKKAMLEAVDKGIEKIIKRVGNLIFLITCYKVKELHKVDNNAFTETDQHSKSKEALPIHSPETKETQSEEAATNTGAAMNIENTKCCLSGIEHKNVCKVEWKIVTPGNWDAERIARALNTVAALLEEVFQIEFVMLGSLIIKTSVPLKIIQSTELLAEAVESFLKNILEKCSIDTKECNAIPVFLTCSVSGDTSISVAAQIDECENCLKLKTDNNVVTELVDDWYKTITEISGGVTSQQHFKICSVCNVLSKSIIQCCFRCNKPMCSDCSLRHKNEALHVTNTFKLGFENSRYQVITRWQICYCR